MLMLKKIFALTIIGILLTAAPLKALASGQIQNQRLVQRYNLLVQRHNAWVDRFNRIQAQRCAGERLENHFCQRLFTQTVRERQKFERLREKLEQRLNVGREQIAVPETDQLGQGVLELVNEERRKQSLEPLAINPLLSQAAQAHAEDMNQKAYFRHESPDGTTPGKRIENTGYLSSIQNCNCSYRYATGENIAWGPETAAELVKSWMESPGHRENILKPDFREMGFGFKNKYAVQTFGVVEKK